MRLPSLSVIIVSQALIWCVAGAIVHGPAILLYPAAWALIAAAFWSHNQLFPMFAAETSASETRVESHPGVAGDRNRKTETVSRQKLAAAD